MLARPQSQVRDPSEILPGMSKLHNSLTSSWILAEFSLGSLLPQHLCNVAQQTTTALLSKAALVRQDSSGWFLPAASAVFTRTRSGTQPQLDHRSTASSHCCLSPCLLPQGGGTSLGFSASFRQETNTVSISIHPPRTPRTYLSSHKITPHPLYLGVPEWDWVSTTPCVQLTSCRYPNFYENSLGAPYTWSGAPLHSHGKGRRKAKTSESPYYCQKVYWAF